MLRLLTSEDLIRIHDEVLLETGVGLAGLAGDKDLSGIWLFVEPHVAKARRQRRLARETMLIAG